MSQTITEAMKVEFSERVRTLAQQKTGRLRAAVEVDNLKGEQAYFDQIGSVEAVERVSRHADTPFTEVPHSRRRVMERDWELGELVDSQDIVRAFDPTSRYIRAFAMALARREDRTIIEAATAAAASGKNGATLVNFPSSQQVAIDYVETGGTANSSMTVAKVRKTARLLNKAEVDMDGRYMIVSADELDSMLRQVEVTSIDYNNVRALVNGEINTWMGFTWIRTELLGLDANGYRRCLAWQKTGILFNEIMPVQTKAAEDTTKGFNWRLYARSSHGAVRMEENHVVEIKCLVQS